MDHRLNEDFRTSAFSDLSSRCLFDCQRTVLNPYGPDNKFLENMIVV